MPWATNDWRKDSPRGIISSKSSLAHAGSIVNDKCGNVLVTHLGAGDLCLVPRKSSWLMNNASLGRTSFYMLSSLPIVRWWWTRSTLPDWALGSACCIKIKVAMHVFRSLWGVFMPKYGHVRNLKHKNSLFLKSSIQQDNLCHHKH